MFKSNRKDLTSDVILRLKEIGQSHLSLAKHGHLPEGCCIACQLSLGRKFPYIRHSDCVVEVNLHALIKLKVN